jgi:fatty acid desaturase
VPGAGGDGGVGSPPRLIDDDSFYSTVRRRLTEHLRSVKCPSGGPTRECCIMFWATVAAFFAAWGFMFASGSVASAVAFGLVASVLGAFGHNWIHQPKYRFWAYLSLDTIGFSSTGWFREHVLQHHMFTNTPWDNHYHGTDPFLVTDPTVQRNWLQAYVMPYINPLILTFGLWGNYVAHLTDMFHGNEEWRVWKLCLPLNVGLMIWRWGLLRGGLLTYIWAGTLSVWYFTMALMNHNAEHTQNVDARNAAKDWGEQQLVSSADWGIGLSFRRAWVYLWLNYHTVHHLFPRLDFSHHPAAQRILLEACAQHKIKYVAAESPLKIYKEMIRSFASPQALFKSVLVYGGDL